MDVGQEEISASITMDKSDEAILYALARCVRLLSVRQVSQIRQSTDASARRRAKHLAERGLVQEVVLLAQSLRGIAGPLARWKPGQAVPDAPRVSRAAVRRFADCPLKRIRAITATRRTLCHYGLDGRAPLNRYQQSHDLGLSEVFLYFLRRWPRLTWRCWIGEDAFRDERERGEKIEDAQLCDPRTAETLLVVEFVGKYRPGRVAAFINEMTRRGLPFMCF